MGEHLGFPDLPARLSLRRLLVSLSLLFAAAPGLAHEMGSFEVRMTVRDSGDYVVELPIDPETLLQRLELIAGGEISSPESAKEYEESILSHQRQILSRIDLRFDGRKVTPAIEYVPDESDNPEERTAILRLTGAIPDGAGGVTWSYSLVYSRYLFVVSHPRAREGVRQWLEADQVSRPVRIDTIAPPLSTTEVLRDYLILGFTHIIPKGLDHILFVLGLFLLSPRWRPVLAQVSAFTVAHTITLGLTTFGLVSLSPSIVEPLIALSIVYIAVENVFTREVHRWRIALVFLFGLLHGMGFAGVLGELGLPRAEFVPALIAFNVGVEAGQLTVILLAWLLLVHWVSARAWYRSRVLIPLSVAIGLAGLVWLVQRSAGG